MDMQVKIRKMFLPNSSTAWSVMERSALRMALMSPISRMVRAFLRARAAGGRRAFTRSMSRFPNPLALGWLRFRTPTSSFFPYTSGMLRSEPTWIFMARLSNRESFEASGMTMALRVWATRPAMPVPMGKALPRESSLYRKRLSPAPLAALISSLLESREGIMIEAFSAEVSSMTMSRRAPATASTSGAWDMASFTRLKTVSSLLIIAFPTKDPPFDDPYRFRLFAFLRALRIFFFFLRSTRFFLGALGICSSRAPARLGSRPSFPRAFFLPEPRLRMSPRMVLNLPMSSETLFRG